PTSSTTAAPTSTAAATTSTTAAPSDPFLTACLARHNQVRALHTDTPSMTWSTLAATTSQAWADDLAARQVFEHSNSSNPAFRTGGENLYLSGTTGTPTDFPAQCTSGTQAWYDEISDYDYANPGFSSATGHFTQVVWQNSIQVGCGSSRYTNSGGFIITLIVCQYTPAGNFLGQFADQVKPLA
ncbi:unnamed protein product, partial [Owenia fusiformis]